MNIYQKAIKVRKVCEDVTNYVMCYGCPYNKDCYNSKIITKLPTNYNLTTIVKAIKKEKWNVK